MGCYQINLRYVGSRDLDVTISRNETRCNKIHLIPSASDGFRPSTFAFFFFPSIDRSCLLVADAHRGLTRPITRYLFNTTTVRVTLEAPGMLVNDKSETSSRRVGVQF